MKTSSIETIGILNIFLAFCLLGAAFGRTIDVRAEYGAMANGIVDDSAKIQAAISAANAGDVVQLRVDSTNSYKAFGVSKNIWLKAGITIEGTGTAYHLVALEGTGGYTMLSLNSDVTVRNINIDGKIIFFTSCTFRLN